MDRRSRRLRRVAAAHRRGRKANLLLAAALWLGGMVAVLIATSVGVAVLKPAALGSMVGFFVGAYATFIGFGRIAFPPHRRKLRWWAAAAVGLAFVTALSLVIAFFLVAVAEAALAWLAVSRDDWLPFDVAELVGVDACPECGEPRLQQARICRHCRHVFEPIARTV